MDANIEKTLEVIADVLGRNFVDLYDGYITPRELAGKILLAVADLADSEGKPS